MEAINVLFHKVPFLRLLIFFALGCFALVKGFSYRYMYVILITASLFLILHLLISKQKDESQFSYRWFFGSSVSAFMFAFGMMFSNYTKSVNAEADSHYYVGCVKTSPSISSKVVQCTVALSEIDESRMQKDGKSFDAVVYIQKSMSSEGISIGDSLLISPNVSSVSTEKNEEFGLDDNHSNTFFVQDGAWSLISKSSALRSESIRDTLIGQLKKKDAMMLN